jgi:hypothetical protein
MGLGSVTHVEPPDMANPVCDLSSFDPYVREFASSIAAAITQIVGV